MLPEVSMEIKKYTLNPILRSHENDNAEKRKDHGIIDNVIEFKSENNALSKTQNKINSLEIKDKKKKARLEQIHRSVLILIRSGQVSSSIH